MCVKTVLKEGIYSPCVMYYYITIIQNSNYTLTLDCPKNNLLTRK